MKTNWDLLTHCICLRLGTSSVSEEVRELGSNQNIVLCEHLGVKPHETGYTRMLEEGHLVVVGHFLWKAQEMGEVALSIVATEIQADAGSVLEGALIGHGFCGRCSLFDVEEAHL